MTHRTCGRCGTYAPRNSTIEWHCPFCDKTYCNRLIVTGGRDYDNRKRVFEVLEKLRPIVVVHGACPTGADAFASEWAKLNDVIEDGYPIHMLNWGGNGPARNQAMVNDGADLVLVFPGGRGTHDCMTKAFKAGLAIKIIKDEDAEEKP